jgi:hypothetical protein
MKVIKLCTDLLQSKKLLELGVDKNTADMYWEHRVVGTMVIYEPRVITLIPHANENIPCWSLAALLKLIPNFNMFKRTIECKLETTNHLVDKACEPINAAFELIIWLKENKKI